MAGLYPEIAPREDGLLDVGDGNHIYWETCGGPAGKPALVLHGGPGSGCTTWHRRLFDPSAYRIVLFDQRGCGRSLPNASGLSTSLESNTTGHLIVDIERLREHLSVDRWLLLGGSWGSTLALAYAEAHPDRVREIVLWGVTTGRRKEFDWLFRAGLSALFPWEWEARRAALPASHQDCDIVEAYRDLLNSADPMVRERAALAWCTWECATPSWPPTHGLSPRFKDPAFRLAFARIVTHYVAHNAWLEDGILLRNAERLASIPGIMISGRFDFQAPIGWAFDLKRVWSGADLIVVDNAGHDPSNVAITRELIRATDRFRHRTVQ
jgi:proline iminopeptidase